MPAWAKPYQSRIKAVSKPYQSRTVAVCIICLQAYSSNARPVQPLSGREIVSISWAIKKGCHQAAPYMYGFNRSMLLDHQ